MQAEDKVDRKVEFSDNNGSPLSRQVTVSMSPEQYERLFFSPTGPQRGDLAKRLGNPTLLGLLCFLIPYTSTMFILIGWGGAVPPTSLVGLDGDYYLIGCIGMTIAGICEFILGNTFPFAVFVIYGTHWASLVSDLLRLHVTQPKLIVVAGLRSRPDPQNDECVWWRAWWSNRRDIQRFTSLA